MSDFMLDGMYDEDTGRGDFYEDNEKSPDVPSDTSEFKACPFCGNMPMKTPNHTVLCETCHREVLPEVWQTRPLEDALRASVKRTKQERDGYHDIVLASICRAEHAEEKQRVAEDMVERFITEVFTIDTTYYIYGEANSVASLRKRMRALVDEYRAINWKRQNE